MRRLALLALILPLLACGAHRARTTAQDSQEAAAASLSLALELGASELERRWVVQTVGGERLGESRVGADGRVRAELELRGPDLYLVALAEHSDEGSRSLDSIQLWIEGQDGELRYDSGADPGWSGSALEPRWLEISAARAAWRGEVRAALEAEGEAGLSRVAEAARADIEAAEGEHRKLLSFEWFASFTNLVAEPGSLRGLAELAEPEDPSWALIAGELPNLLRKQVGYPEARDFDELLEALAARHPSASLRAAARYALLEQAVARGDDEGLRRHWAALDDPDYRETRFFAAAASTYDPGHPLAPSNSIPRLSFPSLDDPARAVVVGEVRERPLLILVWSIHCHFCADEMPNWQAVYEQLGERVDMLSIAVDGTPEEIAAYREQWPMPWEHALIREPGEAEALNERWGLVGVPAIVLVDAAGKVVLANWPLRGPGIVELLAKHL